MADQCPYNCRERNVMLRRHFAGHPGDHIAPEIFERMEALMPKRLDAYAHGNFALVLNAVLQAGLDAIAAGQARTEYTRRGVTIRLGRR